jgi:hypothetical protein
MVSRRRTIVRHRRLPLVGMKRHVKGGTLRIQNNPEESP